jgi:S-adenosylmethionine/arginine decarboxylase-like enzyme
LRPKSVAGALISGESHPAAHPWPEMGSVTVDVYVCNFTTDNTDKAHRVFRALQARFGPTHTSFQAIHRGAVREEKAAVASVA